jgi:Na+-transporting methylmalonyl-CoA/oxaloacetate decarboxylase gamma subunit
MKKHIAKDFIPLLIAIILVLISIGIAVFSPTALNYRHYIGISLVLISTILYFKNKKLYAYVFGLTLLIGTTSLIDIFFMTFGITIVFFRFNPLFLILLIIFLAFNKNLIDKLFPEKKPTEINVADKIAEKEKRIRNYELKYQSKSEMELKRIADENSGYVDEAKVASRNVLREKYVL